MGNKGDPFEARDVPGSTSTKTRSSSSLRLEFGYQLFPVVYFSRGAESPNQKRNGQRSPGLAPNEDPLRPERAEMDPVSGTLETRSKNHPKAETPKQSAGGTTRLTESAPPPPPPQKKNEVPNPKKSRQNSAVSAEWTGLEREARLNQKGKTRPLTKVSTTRQTRS